MKNPMTIQAHVASFTTSHTAAKSMSASSPIKAYAAISDSAGMTRSFGRTLRNFAGGGISAPVASAMPLLRSPTSAFGFSTSFRWMRVSAGTWR